MKAQGYEVALIGLDVGNTNCKIAIREGGGMRLVSDHMPDNMVRDGDVSSPETLSRFLKHVRETEKIRDRDCSVALQSSQVYFRHVSMPPMNVSELLLNLPYEFRDFIQEDPEEYLFDYAVDELVTNEEGDVERMELYASAVRKSLIESYSSTLRNAGFRLKAVMPSQMAYMTLLKQHFGEPGKELPEGHDVVLVDIGHANVVLSLFNGLHFDSARTVDFGCDEFDNIIAGIKGIDPYTASSYKFTNFEGVLDDPECLALCDRFALEVSKVVNFYNFSNPDREISKLYFLGGGASIYQLTHAIADAVSIPCSTISELMPHEARGQENTPACALAVAALLEGESM